VRCSASERITVGVSVQFSSLNRALVSKAITSCTVHRIWDSIELKSDLHYRPRTLNGSVFTVSRAFVRYCGEVEQ